MLTNDYKDRLAVSVNKNSCDVCGRLADSHEDGQLCSVCFRFLAATSPLMIESKLFHFAAMQAAIYQRMLSYLKEHYNEFEDTSYLRSNGQSIFDSLLNTNK